MEQRTFVLHCVETCDDEYNMGIGTSNVVQVPVAFDDGVAQPRQFIEALCEWVQAAGLGIVVTATGASGCVLRRHGLKPRVTKPDFESGSSALTCSVAFANYCFGRSGVHVSLLPATAELHSVVLAAKYSDPVVAAALLSGAQCYIQHWLETEAKHVLMEH